MNTSIVGAGMTGLVLAVRLLEAGDDVTVFERDAVPGGLAAAFTPVVGGARLERFYHHIFRSDRQMIALVAELGLADDLIWSRPKTECLYGGTLSRLDSAASLLAFAPLGWFDRLRLALALGILKGAPSHLPFERARATRWLAAVAGRNALEIVFEPLFRGKFGARADDVSLAWLWARIHDRTPELGYVRDGFAKLYDALVDRVRALGGTVAFGSDVRGIARDGEGIELHVHSESDGESRRTFERAIATIATARLAALSPDYARASAADRPAQPPLAARCLILALDRPLCGTYWINVCEPNWPFLVVVEHTALVPPSEYGGRHIVYIGNYGESFARTDARALAERFAPFLACLNPEYCDEWVLDAWLFVAPDAQPIVEPGYASRMPAHATPIPNLYLANLSQVFPHDRGQNYAVDMAEHLATELVRVAQRRGR